MPRGAIAAALCAAFLAISAPPTPAAPSPAPVVSPAPAASAAISPCTPPSNADAATQAQSFLDRGLAQAKRKQYDAAIRLYTCALSRNDDFLRAWSLRGVAYYHSKQYALAESDFQHALTLDSHAYRVHDFLAEVHQAQGRPENAIRDCTAALQDDPQDTFAYWLRSYAYQKQSRFRDAVADDTRALKIDPADVPAYMERSVAYRRLHQYPQAMADLAQAASLDPRNPWIYGDMGSVDYARGRYSSAAADYTRALELAPGEYRFYSYRCSAHEILGQYRAAVADCSRLLALKPDYWLGYLKRADSYMDQGLYAAALADQTHALALDPRYAGAYFDRGRTRYLMRAYGQAASDFRHAIAFAPATAYEVLWLHLARLRNHQTDTAEFAATTKTARSNAWGRLLLGFYTGSVTKAALFHAASSAGERCEADFYTAEWNALHGHTSLARGGFSGALRICPRNYIEYTAAAPELKALR